MRDRRSDNGRRIRWLEHEGEKREDSRLTNKASSCTSEKRGGRGGGLLISGGWYNVRLMRLKKKVMG